LPNRSSVDEQVIEQVKSGDAEAYGVQHEQYSAVISGYVYSHLGSRLDVEVLQHRALSALKDLMERGSRV
jgi:hypothetical protein